MTAPKRIRVKFFAQNEEPININNVPPIFQTWIQRQALEGLLIDVADYKHVHNGPGIILIGHEGDYAYELGQGRPGVSYTLKVHDSQSLADAVTTALRRAVQASQTLQADPALKNLHIDLSTAQVTIIDRLNYANDAEGLATVESELAEWLSERNAEFTYLEGDSRDPITFTLTTETSFSGVATPA